MRPRGGFSPNSPQFAAGTRIEPPPSEAVREGREARRDAAAVPPLDPAGVRSVSHGLRVAPVADSVKGQIASSGSERLADRGRAGGPQAPHDLGVSCGRGPS